MRNSSYFFLLGVSSVFISLAVCFFLLKWILKASREKKSYDYQDERKIKKAPRPRVGGVGIFVSYFSTLYLLVLVTFLLKGEYFARILGINPVKISLYTGSIFFIFILGLFDDFFPLSVKSKLLTEFVVAVVLYIIGFKISYVSIPFGVGHLVLGNLSFPLTVLWIVGIINAINLIDGLDGLAGGVIAITSLAMIIVLGLEGEYTYALLLTPLLGSILGFLPFNIYPSKIFMGDSGSLFSGALLSTIVLATPQKATFGITLMVPLAILALPILDTLLAFIRRVLKGKNPFSPDADHIHHRFLQKGHNEKKTVTILLSISALFSIIAILFHSAPRKVRSLLLGVLFLVILGLLTYLKYIRVWKKRSPKG